MLFDDLLNNPAKWMVESRDEHDIVSPPASAWRAT